MRIIIFYVSTEIATQPDTWVRAAAVAQGAPHSFPQRGERVAVIGCGTSWFIAQSYAALREAAGHGLTDAFAASEAPLANRDYDTLVAISRSGTTTEIAELLKEAPSGVRRIAITSDADTPAAVLSDERLILDFADERSVVQTRFATSTLALLRASLGENLDAVVASARDALERPLDEEWLAAEQFTFLGQGWTIGIAAEAALKMRESAQLWTESYPAMEYRHGPISIAAPGRVVWSFGPTPSGLADDIRDTGALLVEHGTDALADLIVAQRLGVEMAIRRGLDADNPRSLTRAVILSEH